MYIVAIKKKKKRLAHLPIPSLIFEEHKVTKSCVDERIKKKPKLIAFATKIEKHEAICPTKVALCEIFIKGFVLK